MLILDHNFKPNAREKLLEMRLVTLQERIRELERRSLAIDSLPTDDENKVETNKSSFWVLPVTYTPTQERSPELEIVPHSSTEQSELPVLRVEQSKKKVYETIVWVLIFYNLLNIINKFPANNELDFNVWLEIGLTYVYCTIVGQS